METGHGKQPSNFKGERLPVSLVSWDDAQRFISKLNERRDGFKYRLPTEAEWEYACRAGTTGQHAGDLGHLAWYADNSEKRAHPVGTRQPNAFGLYDMHGNVWEWVEDFYHKNYVEAPVDGSAWLSLGLQSHRVLRGGSWGYGAFILRSATRAGIAPTLPDGNFGFRVVAIVRSQ